MRKIKALAAAAALTLAVAIPAVASAGGSGLHAEVFATHGDPNYFYNGRGMADVLDAASRVYVRVGCSNGTVLGAVGAPGGSGGGQGVWVYPISDCYVKHLGHLDWVTVQLIPAAP